MTINMAARRKNLYWQDADGHLWEILTMIMRGRSTSARRVR